MVLKQMGSLIPDGVMNLWVGLDAHDVDRV